VPAASSLTYVCALAYVDPRSGTERLFEGRCEGRMSAERRGGRGFGYDPVFLPEAGDGRTMAELRGRREGRDQPPRRGDPRARDWLARGRP
jgi:XTP/dITP diphosphohydrolase